MAFEKNKCNVLNKSKLKEEQIIVDINFDTNMLQDFDKICWVNAHPFIENIEKSNREATYSGKVVFEIGYLDSNGKFQTNQTTAPFMNKIINDLITAESTLEINVCVDDVSYLENSQKLQVLLEIQPILYDIEELDVVSSGSEDIIVKEEEIVSQNLILDNCTTFTEEITISIPEAYERILSVNTKTLLKEIEPNNNFFTIHGELISIVHYVVLDEESERVKFIISNQPFKREIEANGTTDNSLVEAFAFINRSEYSYQNDNENKQILINAPLKICFKVFNEVILPIAVDMFSLKNDINIVTNSYTRTKINNLGIIDGKIEGSVILDDSAPRMDKVIAISPCNNKLTNSYANNNEITLEGILDFSITYLNDETQNVVTTKQQLPFVIKKQIEEQEIDEIFVQDVLSDIEIVSRRGREILVDGKLKAHISTTKKISDAVMTDAKLLDELPEKTHALEIYFGKNGDDLWNIAKDLKIKPEVIVNQNPDIVLPLENDQNIIIYNQK